MGQSAESKAASRAISKTEFFCRSCGRYHPNAVKASIGRRTICKICLEKISQRNREIKAGAS